MNQAKNAKKVQPRASQIDKFNKECYTCPHEQVRYSTASYRSQLHDHQVSQPLDKAKMDLGNLQKISSHEQSAKHEQNMSKWRSHTNFMIGQPF
jgi:hypothetical protein